MDNKFYDPNEPFSVFKSYQCGDTIVGGHVVMGRVAQILYDDSFVHSVLICHNHNSCCTENAHLNGTGFFMKPKGRGQGILLRGYVPL